MEVAVLALAVSGRATPQRVGGVMLAVFWAEVCTGLGLELAASETL
jgi:hypothetical protein